MVNTIRDASEFHSTNMFTAVRSFSDTVTAEAIASNQTFPFVTLPAFEALGTGVRSASGAEMINWHPRVEQHQLEEWSQYVLTNYEQNLADSRAIALTLDVAQGSSVEPSDYLDGDIAPLPYIPNFEEGGLILAPTYGDGPYFPAWMVSPPIFNPNFINSDPAPWVLKQPMEAAMTARTPIFSDTVAVENLANRAIKVEDHEAYHQSLVDYVLDPEETAFKHPHTNIMLQVYDKLGDPSSRIVGVFAVIFPWDRYLVNLLPEGVDGITCVVKNTCGKAFTYSLSGNSAFYLGEGDMHEHDYNQTEVVIPFGGDQFSQHAKEPVPGECRYSYHIYATQAFEDDHRSNLPWALTLVVAATFALMIITFLVYDTFVRQRNEKVVGVATKTNAIVSSLFPEQVRDRLMAEDDADDAETGFAEGTKNGSSSRPSASKESRFLSNNKNNIRLEGFLNGEDQGDSPKTSTPIADLYPDCTVFFADIVGFTKWSASREPVDVFKLLESIYESFDQLALRRGVFKVETIGDCYVAITGCPAPRKDHAAVMAKFATNARDRMRTVCKSLQSTLGDDTANLDLRIGLHSGPVTAGVLRGAKSRFQLFGDTVNTAARMESNCRKGKIQVSETTANCLRADGKGGWLIPRKDVVQAKGKGAMQTYWIEPTTNKQSSIGTRTSSTIVDSYDNNNDRFPEEGEASETDKNESEKTSYSGAPTSDETNSDDSN